MCKQRGACVASRRHLEFHHKASLSSVCEKHSHHNRLQLPVILHCNTADCRSLWSSAFVSLLPAICMCGAPSLWCGFDTLYGLHSPSAHTHSHTQMERDGKKERKTARRSLYSLPTLILFIQWICFSLRNPPLISFHLSLWSQFCRFTKVTSKNFPVSLRS